MTSHKSIVNIDGHKFIINNDGNFGIDTTNPTKKLDVNGGIKLSSTLSVGTNPDTGTSGQVLVSKGSSSPPEWENIETGDVTVFNSVYESFNLGSIGGFFSMLDGFVYYSAFYTNVTIKYTRLILYTSEDTTSYTGHIGIAIYTDSSGSPGTKLFEQIVNYTSVLGPGEELIINLLNSEQLQSYTKYWIAISTDVATGSLGVAKNAIVETGNIHLRASTSSTFTSSGFGAIGSLGSSEIDFWFRLYDHTMNTPSTNIIAVNAIGNNLVSNTLGATGSSLTTNAFRNILFGVDSGSSVTDGFNNICIGSGAGQSITTGSVGINIGEEAGRYSNGQEYINIGSRSGHDITGTRSINIGSLAGYTRSGEDSINIGTRANFGNNVTHDNTIILNASGSNFISDNSGGFYVKPIRNTTGNTIVQYNSTSGEISHSSNISVDSMIVTGSEIESVLTKLGSNIYGEAAGDESGFSVSLSRDGTILAVGAINNDDGGTDSGHVRVYQFSSGSWTQLGQDIDGEAADDKFGFSVSLSDDGTILAVGAITNDDGGTDSGKVKVYQISSGSWAPLGQDIIGQNAIEISGYSVSLSGDGTRLAIGVPILSGGGVNRGGVRLYQFSSGFWIPLGQEIYGEANEDFSGYSVSLSNDGNVVAIGSRYNVGSGTVSGTGHVRVYQFSSGSWIQLGQDIDAEADGDNFGFSVSLSDDGTILAVGAINNDDGGTDSGHVRVYQFSSGSWTQLGQDIDGEAAGDNFGNSVSLSGDGTTLAVGAQGNNNVRGKVRVYQFSSGSWVPLGTSLTGENAGDNFGNSVSLSSDGKTVAIGSVGNNTNGIDIGMTSVYIMIDSLVQISSLSNSVYINGDTDIFGKTTIRETLSVGAIPTSGTSGQLLVSKGSNPPEWETITTGGGGASALNDLNDVNIAAPGATEVLKYTGSAWVNSPVNINEINGIDLTLVDNNELLKKGANNSIVGADIITTTTVAGGLVSQKTQFLEASGGLQFPLSSIESVYNNGNYGMFLNPYEGNIGQKRMTINAFLNDIFVGINTDTPLEPLHVSGNLRIDNNTTQQIRFYNIQGSTKEAARIKVDDNGGGADILFLTRPSEGTEPTEKMIIDKTGNVGIGTLSPTEKLHVAGNVNVNDAMLLSSIGNNAMIANKNVFDNPALAEWGIVISGSGSVYLNKPAGQTLNILTGLSSSVLVASDDSVGIGLFPTEKLDVGGNIKSSGTLIVGTTPSNGTSGQVLVSKGSNPPEWETLVTGGGGSSDKINMEVRGVTLRKKQVVYDVSTTITVADIVARLDNPPDYNQVYTFGESITNRWVAVGYGGANTLAYSSDGINWTGLGKTIFSSQANYVEWSGSLWVAAGFGSANTLAYSSDGINWTGLGKTIFSVGGEAVKWNGSVWVAGGVGSSNTLAYSSDGINWTGLGKTIFSTTCFVLAWNGSIWIAGGQGTNTIAYSSDGINWTGVTSVFSSVCFGLAWNGILWVAGGQGTNTLAYSSDGINWTGLGTNIFDFRGETIAWNGILWVAGGIGSPNTLAYSYDGINWIGLGTSVFSSEGLGLNWNGTLWWACGSGGPNTMAYSYDGIHWVGLQKTIFSGWGFHAAFNNRRPHTITFSSGSTSNGTVSISGGSITLNGTTLDLVADSYHNNGYTNFSVKIL